ncbi:hypothetical protein PsYK624_133140 [Phanerochaete sordida]|uniref:Uncharacterized protein n=1 Tax=Phanerochaete sordida TaxID=48140 RepID=A0A9P3GLF7_9APHY|nr:hypothetical protein PsYK624_133140 [Phanerochaete sordida]
MPVRSKTERTTPPQDPLKPIIWVAGIPEQERRRAAGRPTQQLAHNFASRSCGCISLSLWLHRMYLGIIPGIIDLYRRADSDPHHVG